MLRKEGLLQQSIGFDAVVWGNIPSSGMSRFLCRVAAMASGPDAINNAPRRRSASLCLNLIATWLDVNGATLPPPAPGSLAREVELAVQVENAYVGSPCGNLDQIMIWWRPRVEIQSRRWRGGGRTRRRGDGRWCGRCAWPNASTRRGRSVDRQRGERDAETSNKKNNKKQTGTRAPGAGTLYEPEAKKISYIPLGAGAPDFAFVALDTGTDRPGFEKSTYKDRRRSATPSPRSCSRRVLLIDRCSRTSRSRTSVKSATPTLIQSGRRTWSASRTSSTPRMNFGGMIDAWRRGDVEEVGAYFRRDGRGLRDLYRISGPELETMCATSRAPSTACYGERMLGGGDKGAAGAIVRRAPSRRSRRPSRAPTPWRTRATRAPCTRSASRPAWRRSRGALV